MLLLQVSANQQPTPYAVYATLAVGVLSLIASGLNIYFSSKTAQKVVNLSTKTTREVAELSAQVSRESANLAVQTARELKEKDYKNDFYKKIIEKRLNAWEQIASVLSLVVTSVVDLSDKTELYTYFLDVKSFYSVFVKLDSLVVSQILWMDESFIDCFVEFHLLLVSLSSQAELTIQNMDSGEGDGSKLLQVGKDNYEVLQIKVATLLALLQMQLVELHDVEKFFDKNSLTSSPN